MPVGALLNKGVSCHQAGQLADAERYYKEALAVDPNQSDAMHLLGVIASQVGKHELAVQMITRAIEISPNHPMYFNNLAHVSKNLDNPDRLFFAGRLPKDEHLARHQVADLALDTRVYNGHTTTSDALWAGVPVIT
jgi:predicted O-linked N-acetylglucosamine transferase (SPINDLY family)